MDVAGGPIAVRRKVIGLIEQAICAGGRTFFGTQVNSQPRHHARASLCQPEQTAACRVVHQLTRCIGCAPFGALPADPLLFSLQHSTFTSYIFRLRGYIRAPDTMMRWHNIRYTGVRSLDVMTEPIPDGQAYMIEDKTMWEDSASV